jgi:PAS domain S-box-containing protein
LISLTVVEYQTTAKAVEAEHWADHSYRVLQLLGDVTITELQAQNSARGYALTRDPAVRASSEDSMQQLDLSLRQLRRLTADNPRQQARLNELDPIVRQLLRLLASMNDQPDYGASLAGRGQAEASEMRQIIGRMRREENQLLGGRETSSIPVPPLALGCFSVITMVVGSTFTIRLIRRLSRTERQFQDVLEAAPEAAVVIDKAGRMVLVNAQTEKLFGYSRDELLGSAIGMLISERDRERYRGHPQSFFTPASAPVSDEDFDLTGRRKDGSEFPIEIGLSPLEIGDEALVSGAIRDVTEHKRIEEKLRAQADRLQEQASLLDVAHDAIVVRGLGGEIRFWNQGAESIYGWTKAEAIGKISHVLLQTRSQPPMAEVEALLLRDGRWEGDIVHTRRDGSRITVASRQVLRQDERGNSVLEIDNDITRRKQAEERFAQLLEGAPDAMVVLNREGKIVLVNAQVTKLFGYSKEELLDAQIAMLVPDRSGLFTERRAQLMAGGLELQGVRRDGSAFPVEISVNPLETREGTLFSSAIRDITERKRGEEQIQKLNQELQGGNAELAAANQELQAFTYSIAHDLRSPLRHIQGYSKLLGEHLGAEASARAQEYLQDIAESAINMGCMVDDLLGLARIGRQELDIQVTGLNFLVAEVIEDIQRDLGDRAIEWRIGDLPYLDCDPGLIRQVLFNLLSNAVKYTRPRHPAVIEVGQLLGKTRPTIFVRDNGVGFNMEYADKLFGLFHRLHRKEDFEGTGVGLAVVQRIVQKHGGAVWAEAELDKGATFFFNLAATRAGEAKEAA